MRITRLKGSTSVLNNCAGVTCVTRQISATVGLSLSQNLPVGFFPASNSSIACNPLWSQCWIRYDPCGHRLQLLAVKDRAALKRLDANCTEILPEARGMVMVLLGDLSRVKAVYDNPWSLLWRDAGALLQTLALCAAAYRLAFCPLGALGSEILGALDLGGRDIIPAGIAMIGRPVDNAQPAK